MMWMLFAFSPSPFSKAKFAVYMLGLAALAAVALAPARQHEAVAAAPVQDTSAGAATVFDLQRFGRSSDELLDRLPAIGIPWFLRRAGVTAQVDTTIATQPVTTLTWEGKLVGRYLERVEPIDTDRARLYIAFVPDDMGLVLRLVPPIGSTLDPVSLMRAALAEHVRSSIDGDGFQLRAVKSGATRSRLDDAVSALRYEQRRDSDDFLLADGDKENAGIRRAYQEEAKRAGAAAPKL